MNPTDNIYQIESRNEIIKNLLGKDEERDQLETQ